MAEVLRALVSEEAKAYMPMREIRDPQKHEELYEAVGEQLVMLYELNEELSAGDFLVRLNDKALVAFSYGLCEVSA